MTAAAFFHTPMPRIRWIYVHPDGTEEDFLTEPLHVKTFRVRIIKLTATSVEEDTVTTDKEGEPDPPPGGHWLVMQRRRDGSTKWWRRRYV